MVNEKVVLVPWVHFVGSRLHLDILDYLIKLRPNSIVALEVSPLNYLKLQFLIDVLTNKADLKKYSKKKEIAVVNEIYENPIEFLRSLKPDLVAVFEVLLECRRRGINVVPLENQKTYDEVLDHKNNKDADRTKDLEKIVLDREYPFVENILELSSRSKQKVHVITGTTHILGLQELLTAKGIDAKIHLDFDHVSRVDVLRYINLSREVFVLKDKYDHELEKDPKQAKITLSKLRQSLREINGLSSKYSLTEAEVVHRLSYKLDVLIDKFKNKRIIKLAKKSEIRPKEHKLRI